MNATKNPRRWSRPQLLTVLLAPLAQIYVLGAFVAIVFGKSSLNNATQIPVGWIDYWLANDYSQTVVGVALVFGLGICGVLFRHRWIVISSTVALALFWFGVYSLTIAFLVFGAPGTGG